MCRLKRYTSKIFLSLSLTDTDKFKDILGNHCYIRVCSCRHIYSFKYKITDHVYPQFLLRFAPCVHQIDGQDIVHADRGEDDVVLVVRCQTLVQRRCKRWRGQWEWRWWRWYRGHCTLDTLKTCPHSNKRVSCLCVYEVGGKAVCPSHLCNALSLSVWTTCSLLPWQLLTLNLYLSIF